jgi:hypothetical protein
MPTLAYTVPGATEIKYVDGPQPELGSCMGGWEFFEDINDSSWDWTWVPNPKDPPYIYQFGNQWNPPEFKASLRYHVDGATEIKYMDRRTRRLPDYGDHWRVHVNIEEFDYSWEPNPFDPPYIYVFGNQWNSAVLEPTVAYHVDGATEIKYVDDITAKVAQTPAAFELIDDIEEFDYSWRPNPTDPPYIYVFGNQWLTPEQRPALQHRVGDATEIKYMDQPKAHRRGNPELFQTDIMTSENFQNYSSERDKLQSLYDEYDVKTPVVGELANVVYVGISQGYFNFDGGFKDFVRIEDKQKNDFLLIMIMFISKNGIISTKLYQFLFVFFVVVVNKLSLYIVMYSSTLYYTYYTHE